jgi:hypothetical protein
VRSISAPIAGGTSDFTQAIDDAVGLEVERRAQIDVEPFRPTAIGELAPPLPRSRVRRTRPPSRLPDALLVAEPTDGCDEVKFTLLALEGGPHSSGILLAELGHPVRQFSALGCVGAGPCPCSRPGVALSGPSERSS